MQYVEELAGAGTNILPLIRHGLPVAAAQKFIASGAVTAAELHALVLPRKTLAHRQKLGTLTPDQSDRLMRLARMVAQTEQVFGSREKAHDWLRRPSTALAGEAPLHLLDTDEGTRQVEALLLRIGHGIAA